MSHYNKIEISGHAGRDAEVRSTSTGKQIASVSIGVSQGDGKPTIWLTIDAWGGDPAFDVISSVRKGQAVGVEGRLQMREWTDKEGNLRQTWQVAARDAELVRLPPREGARHPERAPERAERQPDRAYSPKPAPPVDHDDDPIPF